MLLPSCPGLLTTASPAIVAERPAAALQWLLGAIKVNPLVGLGEMHGSASQHYLIRQLVSHPDFAADDLVIEFGNALYQDVLDAYISGEDISIERLRQVWRNTTQSPINTWEDPIYAQLLATVREANGAGGRLRVLAGDPPVDWGKVEKVEDWFAFLTNRDSHYVSVVEREVLGHGRRALLLIGGMHLLRTEPLGVGARFPHMPIIMPHGGYGALNEEVETVMRDWPVPSISPVAGTPLARFTMAHLNSQVFDHEGKPARFPPWRWEQLFDYYLYLGPRATLRRSALATSYEPEFQAELQRRRKITSRLPPPPRRPRSDHG